ncbi:hypothetical protein C1H46_001887 [Malus baccata]|uniref:Squalene cyclase N-terminal domain-containing protein n=1 Tax=Malus baccata TaxID=106549 RepID=A0A540NN80_MALBA|nr:hypothetical protein C1H46_001887 [Malus baccata]
MFCTALNYICMRILGEGPDGGQDKACARARKWILDHGSVTHIPSWGKTWLSEITGAFMKNCMLHYAAYRNIYPLWALAEYRRRVPFVDV